MGWVRHRTGFPGCRIADDCPHDAYQSSERRQQSCLRARVYHVVPGKLPALEQRFRDSTSKLLAKHDLKVVGYWVHEDDPASDNTFIFMLAHASREEAKKNWDAMRTDPEFQETVKSEQTDKLVERVDSTYMLPTNFSPMK